MSDLSWGGRKRWFGLWGSGSVRREFGGVLERWRSRKRMSSAKRCVILGKEMRDFG